MTGTVFDVRVIGTAFRRIGGSAAIVATQIRAQCPQGVVDGACEELAKTIELANDVERELAPRSDRKALKHRASEGV